MRPKLRFLPALAAILAAVLSPGRPASAQTLRISPQWTPQAQFAGLYAAREKGFYREAGLTVEFRHPSPTRSSLDMLRSGETDIILAQLVDALVLRGSGLQMCNILQCNEHNALMLISRTPVSGPAGLRGKRVGHWKAGFSTPAFLFDRAEGLDIEWIPFHSNIALYISGAIDATTAMEYNEYFQLLMSGTPLREEQILRLRDQGFDIQEDGCYVLEDFLDANRETLRKFVEATRKGWEWTRNNREEALEIVMQYMKAHRIHSNRVNQRHMLDTILELQLDDTGSAPYRVDRQRYGQTVGLLEEYGYIPERIRFDEFVVTF